MGRSLVAQHHGRLVFPQVVARLGAGDENNVVVMASLSGSTVLRSKARTRCHQICVAVALDLNFTAPFCQYVLDVSFLILLAF